MPNQPHGGTLINRTINGNAAEWQRQNADLPRITLNARQLSDLYLIGNGGLSPLAGFMGAADYKNVVENKRMARGLAWTIPVVLAVADNQADSFKPGQKALLVNASNQPVGAIHITEKYARDHENEARKVYGTPEDKHPGVAAIYREGKWLLAGDVDVLPKPEDPDYAGHQLTPAEVRAAMTAKGWNTMVGFQTRNPVHRAHEYIQKCALETVDGLLLHPLVGETKSDDIPAEVRMKCYRALLDNYYPKDRTLLSTLPAAMRYAGPREAIFHSIMRKNYGCTHFIVGRDHAGVGNYYGTYDAQKIFLEFTREELGIQPMFFENSFYCKACDGMASEKTCPHNGDSRLILSGTKVRDLLRAGQPLPKEFSRPEVAAILIEAMKEKEAAQTA